MKQKVKIKLGPGTLAPTTRGLWQGAAEKLRDAKAAIITMESATDRISFENAWNDFVDSLQLFWIRLELGSRANGTIRSWVGQFKNQRKKDDLLTYLYQARHIYQHGAIPLEWEQITTTFGIGNSGHIKTLGPIKDGHVEVDFEPLPGADEVFNVVADKGRPLLAPLVNRKHKQSFPPPTSHLGKQIADSSPVSVAKIGIDYYEDMFDQAIRTFGATSKT